MSAAARLAADEPLPFDEAVARVRAEIAPLPDEEVPLEEAYGRVLAAPVRAAHALPPFANSAVDGFAVRAEDVAGAGPDHPVTLAVAGEATAGHPASTPVRPGRAVRIMTGAPLPDGADALVMLEWTEWTDREVRVFRAPHAGRHIRRPGEDVAAGAEVLPAGRALAPPDVGLLAALGHARVRVRRRPRVALLVTGDELLRPEEPLAPGRIRSANDWTLRGALRDAGAREQWLGLGRDTLDDLASRIARGAEADVLLVSGGVSVGDRDLLGAALAGVGFTKIFWRVLSSPGKPLLFGRLGATLVFGLPGNPVSALVAFENFVRPSLRRLEGDANPERPRLPARAGAAIEGPKDRRHFARVRLVVDAGGARVREVGPTGSGNLSSLVRANALAVVPEGRARVEEGELVETMLLGAPDGPGSG